MAADPTKLAQRLAELEKENAQLKQQLSKLATKTESKTEQDSIDYSQNKHNTNNPSEWNNSLISNYDTFIFDCDGVVWRGSTAITGAKEALHYLQKQNKRLIFLSNNSTKTVATYQSKFKKLFDIDIPKTNIFTSAIATANYLNTLVKNSSQNADHSQTNTNSANNANNTKNTNNTHSTQDTLEVKQQTEPTETQQSQMSLKTVQDRFKMEDFSLKRDKILLIGRDGLYETIKEFGFQILWTSDEKQFPQLRSLSAGQIADLELDKDVKAVVCGMDQYYTYNDVSIACRYLNEFENMLLIGSNDDTTFPSKPGILLAGTGTILAAVNACNERNKHSMVVCGKPHKLLFDLINNAHNGIDAKRTLMVGDRLNTDIIFGKKCGLDTLLVFSGVTSEKGLEKSEINPDYCVSSVEKLV